MDNTLLIGVSRQVALERQMDVVANNIANINTAGFKALKSVFAEFLTSNARDDGVSSEDQQVHFVFDRTAFRDLGQGSIQQTGNPLDVAIAGNAFLSVQTAAGERFTRDGALTTNAAGQLVTLQGAVVNGDGGPIVFQANDRNIMISADGRVGALDGLTNLETQRGKLRLTTFAQPQQLQAEGDNLFSPPGGVAGTPATAAVRVIQGAVESSNVNAVHEMTRMIEINRTYSMIASVLQKQQATTSLDKLAAVPS
jgi:flagellar basal-body rod protein FlgF